MNVLPGVPSDLKRTSPPRARNWPRSRPSNGQTHVPNATGAGSDVTSATVLVMKDSFDVGMDLLADVVRRPVFAAEEIDRQRKQAIANLGVSLEDPGFVAGAVLSRLQQKDVQTGE